MPTRHSHTSSLPPWADASALERPQTAPAKASSGAGAADRASRSTGPPPLPGAVASLARFTQASSLAPLLAPRGADASQPPAVRLVRLSWLERRAAALSRCRTDEERAELALPGRVQLEETEPVRVVVKRLAAQTLDAAQEGPLRLLLL